MFFLLLGILFLQWRHNQISGSSACSEQCYTMKVLRLSVRWEQPKRNEQGYSWKDLRKNLEEERNTWRECAGNQDELNERRHEAIYRSTLGFLRHLVYNWRREWWTKRAGSDSCTATVEGVETNWRMRKERCTRQFALSVERNAKYHSSPMAADPYTAESATQRERPQEEIDSRLSEQLSEIGFLQLHSFLNHLNRNCHFDRSIGFAAGAEVPLTR